MPDWIVQTLAVYGAINLIASGAFLALILAMPQRNRDHKGDFHA